MTASISNHGVVTEDIVYHRVDGQELWATIYKPAGDGPFPGVVSVHGGRWSAESRFTNAIIDKALAEAGIVVMAIDFRLAPQTRYPLPVADINVAIRWLKANAACFDVAPEKIGGVGTSSGGHQLILNALKPRDPDYARYAVDSAPDFSGDASLAYAVVCWAVLDPLARFNYALEQDMTLHVDSHLAYFTDEAEMFAASPQRIVAAREATHWPALLVIQGTADTILTPGMADRLVAAYKEAGGSVAFKKYAGEPHTFITKRPDSPASAAAIADMILFIKAQTGGQSGSLAPDSSEF